MAHGNILEQRLKWVCGFYITLIISPMLEYQATGRWGPGLKDDPLNYDLMYLFSNRVTLVFNLIQQWIESSPISITDPYPLF